MDKLVATFHTTRMLMTCGDDEVFKAVLPPPSKVHRHTLLEGLSLWFDRRISVVRCVAVEESTSVLNLYDELDYGHTTLHYDVEVVDPGRRRRGQHISGMGAFRDLKQLCLRGV